MDDKTKKDQLQAVWFAAGMAVVIACLERAAVMSIFKQWHMWVFLLLNLLLIAILFTSTHPPPKSHSGQDSDGNTKSRLAPAVAETNHHENDVVENVVNELKVGSFQEREDVGFEEEEDGGVGGGDDEKLSSAMLSNEELNEKVEAFISRFRQQYLVSDVKISRSRSDNVCGNGVFSKTITV